MDAERDEWEEEVAIMPQMMKSALSFVVRVIMVVWVLGSWLELEAAVTLRRCGRSEESGRSHLVEVLDKQQRGCRVEHTCANPAGDLLGPKVPGVGS